MPERNIDFWIWVWSLGPDIRAAIWAAMGGAMRAIVMHREGARIRLLDVATTIFMAVCWGTALHSTVPGVHSALERWVGWALPAGVDLFPASMIIVGLSATALTMGLIDFGMELMRRFGGRSK